MHEILDRTKDEQRGDSVPVTPSDDKSNVARRESWRTGRGVNFANGMLESSSRKQPRRSTDFLISLAAQGAFVVFLMLLPLVYTQAFDTQDFEKTVLVMPPPPPAPPPRVETRVILKPKEPLFDNNKLIAPRVIPKKVIIVKEMPQEPSGPVGVSGGVVGGVPGGTLGGVLGGILSSARPPAPPPPKMVVNNKPILVGGRIRAPRLVQEVKPVYPLLAKETRTQGNVVLDCVIDENGNVTQVKLISGHPLLVTAALQAVRQWKYQPTLLNGIPVAVEMKVTVTFTMGS